MMPPGSRWRSVLQPDHPLVGAIWSVAEGRRVDARVLAGELHAARHRLLGEVHDNPDHHEIQLTLLRSLAEAGLKPAVAFEQFDREHDAALRQRLAGTNVTADDVASAVNFNHKGWDWNFYRPLVAMALRHGMPLRAANLSRAAAQPIIEGGLEVLGSGRIAALRIEAAWTPRRENALRRIIFDGHCRALPKRLLPSMAAAQRARDATLAAAMLDAVADGAVLIAGNGHVRRDLGVPLYLGAADASASICAVGIVEVEEGKTDPRSYVDTEASPPPAFDFVCFTPQWSRPDPCAEFKPRAGQPEG